MFVALRDLRFARGRFALMGAVVALVSLLMVLLTGLSTGLVDDNVSAIADLPADHLSFSAESGVKFNQSTVTRDQWTKVGAAPGVEAAAPVGNTLFNGHVYASSQLAGQAHDEVERQGKATSPETASATSVSLALFGIEPSSFVAPAITSGSAIGATPNGVVISNDLARKDGVAIGDVIVLDRVGTELTVVGISPKANFGHVPVIWAPLALWQEASFGSTAGGGARDVATFVALRTNASFDAATADAGTGLQTVTRTAAFAGSPGYKEETGTLLMIEVFLYVIAALLVAAFFTVWTIQRTSEIGLLKALGGGTRYVIKDALGQAVIVLVGATAIGVLVGLAFGRAIPGNAPFALQPVPVLGAATLLVVMGLAGAGFSIRRIAKVDPLIALSQGGAR
jgi:putative ABC transport system permease protein